MQVTINQINFKEREFTTLFFYVLSAGEKP